MLKKRIISRDLPWKFASDVEILDPTSSKNNNQKLLIFPRDLVRSSLTNVGDISRENLTLRSSRHECWGYFDRKPHFVPVSEGEEKRREERREEEERHR